MSPNLPFKLIGIVSVMMLAGNSWAQTAPSLPGSVQPSQVGAAIRSQQPGATPQVLPPVLAPKQEAPTGLTAQAQKIKFQLNKIILKGNRIYSEAQLRPLYQHDLHHTITVAELFKIVQDITNYYRNNGYILSRAILPPQHVKGGVVTIQVIEGYIGAVNVQGKPNGAKCLVQKFGERIKACPPLQLSRMERYLLLANEIPGTQVRSVLSPSKTQTGAAD